jgi:hypothetical protein
MKIYALLLACFFSYGMENKKMFCNYTQEKGITVTKFTAVCIQGLAPYHGKPNPACHHIENPGYPKTLIPTTEHHSYCPKEQLPYIVKK